jgi:hypothetical protein
MLQKFLVLFLVLSLSLPAADKLKMKSGSYMSGEVLKVTDKGILFKMDGMEKLIELQWDVIDAECKANLISKHGISKTETAEEPKKEEETNNDKPETKTDGPAKTDKENVEINYTHLGRGILMSYMSNMKSLVNDMIGGIDYMVADGIQINTKDGKILRGVIVKETDTELNLKFNDLPLVVKREDIATTKKIVLKMKKGTLDFKDFQKYAETTLHENCLRLAASEEGIKYEEAKYIWGVRISGGVLPTDSGEKKFNGYKFNRTIDLGESSSLFGDKKSATGLKKFPDEEKWNSLKMTNKENIIMAINVLKNFPRSDWTDRQCPACKGEGVIKSSEFPKEGAKPKGKDIRPDKPKEKDGDNAGKGKTCTECNGITKSYTLKFE